MRSTERLLALIRETDPRCPIPAHARIERTRAGRLQRELGAWSWYVVDDDRNEPTNIGSQWPVKQCLNEGIKVTFYNYVRRGDPEPEAAADWHVYPASMG